MIAAQERELRLAALLKVYTEDAVLAHEEIDAMRMGDERRMRHIQRRRARLDYEELYDDDSDEVA